MDDSQILDLYFARNEQAIQESDSKYGGYCYSIAYNVLTNQQDAEESVSDTYMAAWNSIPPNRPSLLGAFLGKITRHISIDRWRTNNAYKRTGGEIQIALEELDEVASQSDTPEAAASLAEVTESINTFLDKLPEIERRVFLCRYWYLDSINDIADKTGFTANKVASMLHRIRSKLKKQLAKEELL